MADHVTFQGGPLAGFSLRGEFHRPSIDVPNQPVRYPDRVVVQYDTTHAQWLLESDPDIPFTADKSKVLAAEYEFDIGLGYFEFSGWSLTERTCREDT
jgi:hypothetical protein